MRFFSTSRVTRHSSLFLLLLSFSSAWAGDLVLSWTNSWTYDCGAISIENPEFTDKVQTVHISSNSDLSQVCKTLIGAKYDYLFEYRESAGLQKIVFISQEGKRSEIQNLPDEFLTHIACHNPSLPVKASQNHKKITLHKDGSVTIHKPKVSTTNQYRQSKQLLISAKSNLDGVCERFGYGPHLIDHKDNKTSSYRIPGTLATGFTTMVTIGRNGFPNGKKQYRKYISKIVCSGKPQTSTPNPDLESTSSRMPLISE